MNGYSNWKRSKNKDYFYHNIVTNQKTNDNPFKNKLVCEKLNSIIWKGNSCYLNSVLYSLLAIPNNFIDELLSYDIKQRPGVDNKIEDVKVRQEIQQELMLLKNYIRCFIPGIKLRYNSNNLRNIFKKLEINNPESKWWDGKPKDSGEFLIFLMDLFQSKTNTSFMEQSGYHMESGVKVKDDVIIDTKKSVVVSVENEQLNKREIKITKFLNQTFKHKWEAPSRVGAPLDPWISKDGKQYTVRIQEKKIIDSKYIIFNIMRKYISVEAGRLIKRINKSKIIPGKSFTIESGKIFFLSSIVVYVSKCHYVCYYVCDSVWYLHDDTETKIKKIGDYTDLLNEDVDVQRNGVLYFYSEDYTFI
jgi:uncharacterized UBP type Zn finger protein